MEANTAEHNREIKAVVLDIEGTTCPVSFVAQTLFPYARKQLSVTICNPNRKPAISKAIQEAVAEWHEDTDPISKKLLIKASNPTTPSEEDVIKYFEYLIQCDRKSTALKELQGIIWEQGYASGKLESPLYEDVVPALKRWKKQGLLLAVYSSGSIKAQQLLYSHTKSGNISDYFSQWFDTRTGSKLETNSYTKISKTIRIKPESIVFISDHPGECDAAQASGMSTRFCLRKENPHQDSGRHQTTHSLLEIKLKNNNR